MERNVTRAAKRLHLTQPAVSTQLARLRRVFDDPLLIPAKSGRGMLPSARALALAAPLRAVLKDLEAVVAYRPDFDPLTARRRFQIAADDNATSVLGLPLMEILPKLAGSGGSFHDFMDEHLEQLGRQREVALSVQSFTLVVELLSATNYVATLPHRLAQRYADRLDAFELPFPARGFTLFAAWHPRNRPIRRSAGCATRWRRSRRRDVPTLIMPATIAHLIGAVSGKLGHHGDGSPASELHAG